jgi:hypothetical protein
VWGWKVGGWVGTGCVGAWGDGVNGVADDPLAEPLGDESPASLVTGVEVVSAVESVAAMTPASVPAMPTLSAAAMTRPLELSRLRSVTPPLWAQSLKGS